MTKPRIIIIAVLLIALMVPYFAKNVVAKIFFEQGAEAITGLKLSIKDINVGILKTYIDIKGLKLFNPQGFPENLMADMSRVYLDYDLGSFVKGKACFEEMRLNAEEVLIVRNKEGKLNINSLKVIEPAKNRLDHSKKTKMPEIEIDLLKLKIGKVVFKDYSTGFLVTTEFNVNVDLEYRDVSNAYDFVGLLVWNSLKDTNIPSMTDFDLSLIANNVDKIANRASEISKEVVSRTIGVGKDIGKEASAVVDETKKAIIKILPITRDKGGHNAGQ